MKQALTRGFSDIDLHYLRAGYPSRSLAPRAPATPGDRAPGSTRPAFAALLRRLRAALARGRTARRPA